MGGGGYNIRVAKLKASTDYSTKSREEVFSQRNLDPLMDPKRAEIRESRDSDEHPESFPIIIALDETGSMGHIPEKLIKDIFPDIMEKILNAGVPNPQVLFMGIGDCCYNEQAPLQVGQFESSDELMEKWLTKIYLEGRGGGNRHESYPIAWYFTHRHVVTDAWEKRKVKGVLITIGDEPCQRLLTKEQLNRYVDNAQADVTISELLPEVQKYWNVFHIHCEGSHSYSFKETNWEQLLGINAVVSEDHDGSDIAEIIPKLVISCYNQRNIESVEE